ncbi:uncharacterized protein B0T23DRAFT_407752 [Neurospora hispaniola]|uniref:Uncharacterized protein n=1 Tax=Neurospora hispaniola TaxID=588809 RepID=A0AAJ0I1C9_9PEZI|nr:hypothetical protein B0T23DRAFT_407752 [Neurospora hispaniola]
MSDNANTHGLPLYALGSYGSSAASRRTPLQTGFISVCLHRPYRDTRIFRIPRPESFEELELMACRKCGVLAQPRELVAWNWGRFRDSLSNSATTPTLKIFWQPSRATLRDLRDTTALYLVLFSMISSILCGSIKKSHNMS